MDIPLSKKCLILGHLGLGDLLIINGLVRYYETKYNNILVLCRENNYKSILQIYLDSSIIHPICIDTNNHIISKDHHILNNLEEYDIIKIGMNNDNWESLKSNLLIGEIPLSFFKTFYKQVNLDYNLRYEYEKINRDYNKEDIFYNKVISNYKKYIFIHDDEKKCLDIFNNNNYPIFHPNKNYHNNTSKYYNYWNSIISDNILDYCKIIENAEELHVIFSSFFNLCVFLDLSKVKEKYIYTNITNIKDLHKNLKDWKIIYT